MQRQLELTTHAARKQQLGQAHRGARPRSAASKELSTVTRRVAHYHDATKHHFNRFARSAGHLDWATQPDPFRRFAGAPLVALPRDAVARPTCRTTRCSTARAPAAADRRRRRSASSCAARWGCRPGSSTGARAGRCASTRRAATFIPPRPTSIRDGRVCHYAPREHALEERARCLDACAAVAGGRDGVPRRR